VSEKPTAHQDSEWNGHTAKEWSLALQSLTPQGSEFASDPAACVEYVREERAAMWKRFKAALKELREMRASPPAADAPPPDPADDPLWWGSQGAAPSADAPPEPRGPCFVEGCADDAQNAALTERLVAAQAQISDADATAEAWATELEAKNRALTERLEKLEKALAAARDVGTHLLNLNRIPTEAEYIHGYCEVDRIVRAALAPAEYSE
jgi:hypothetical protein